MTTPQTKKPRCEKHCRDMECVELAKDSPLRKMEGFVEQEGQFSYCPQCNDELKAYEAYTLRQEELARAEELKKKATENKYAHLNIGKRFERATFGNYMVETREQEIVKRTCESYTRTFVDRRAQGDGLILSGHIGTGKNHLAAAIAKEVSDQGFLVVHTTAMKLVREIKETWGNKGPRTEREAIKSFVHPDLLIVDEVGVQYGSTAEQIVFMDVINDRYADERPTILISMLSVEEMAKAVGPHIIDRFKEGRSSIIKLTWESYRKSSAISNGAGQGRA